jgi:hypothetical protein
MVFISYLFYFSFLTHAYCKSRAKVPGSENFLNFGKRGAGEYFKSERGVLKRNSSLIYFEANHHDSSSLAMTILPSKIF